MAASAAVKKKRFDIGGASDAPAAAEVVAPAKDSVSAVAVPVATETAAKPVAAAPVYQPAPVAQTSPYPPYTPYQ